MDKNSILRWALPAIIFSTNLALFSLPAGADDSGQGADNDLTELQRQEAQMKANIDKLNQSNPYIEHPTTPTTPVLPGEVAPNAAFEKLSTVMRNPAVQGYMKIFSNPVLTAQLEQVIKTPNRQIIFFTEAVAFILFLMFRAWCSAKITHWFVGLIVRTITNLSYFAIGSIAIPWIFIGDPYSRLITTLFQSATNLIKF